MLPLLTSKDAAQCLHLTEQTLRILRMNGKGPKYVRLGDGPKARVRYRPEDLEAYVAERAYQSTAEESVRASRADA